MREPYGIALSSAAWQDLKAVQRQHPEAYREFITGCIPRLVLDPLGASEPLYGDLAGKHSLHFGRKPELRAVFVIDERTVLVIAIASHDDAYRRAKDRR